MTAKEILDFWFAPECKACWFNATSEMDEMIRRQFEATWQAARDNKLQSWMDSANGCLALVIILDQFPLNMYRGKAESFLTEAAAREVSRHAIEQGFEQDMSDERKLFLFLPFMHSENIQDQDESLALFAKADMQDGLRFAKHHRDIVARFGRFPHRNNILGRENSAEEDAYMHSDEAFTG
ncbi:MAG: DUF924 domain-containing protein [Gammaproteobacteria bacterium]|nr:DUF924 domain-containing protein [Gammaproteobacteria bacterium]